MIAFHGDKKIKAKYLRRVRAHAAADEIIKGQYWEGGKGCAVGCTIHSSYHGYYESELGIPEALAHLEDTIFENLPADLAKTWPHRFLSAPSVGADLALVSSRFLLEILTGEKGVIRHAGTASQAVQTVADLYSRRLSGDEPDRAEWAEAARARAAEMAAARAARAARAAAAEAEVAAARAAWWAAAVEAEVARARAAAAAARAEAEVAAARAAWWAAAVAAEVARAAHWVWMSETLLRFLREAPVQTI
jgi:hypothetical protein